jgi:hypothetical protein
MMPLPFKSPEESGEAPDKKPSQPNQKEEHRMEQPAVPLGEQIRAHTNRPHKGDVGRPGTNEEVFQGSKMKELK